MKIKQKRSYLHMKNRSFKLYVCTVLLVHTMGRPKRVFEFIHVIYDITHNFFAYLSKNKQQIQKFKMRDLLIQPRVILELLTGNFNVYKLI